MRQCHSRGWLGLFLFVVLSPQAQADNTITWTTGYEYHHTMQKLESGKTYLGFIEVTITDGKNTETLRTNIEEVIPK